MLIGITPLLGPDLLYALRAMGHGDEIAIVDGNYPALEHARRLVRADGHGVMAVVAAILQVMPLDRDQPALMRAALHNDPAQKGPFHQEFDAFCATAAKSFQVLPLAGADLYPRIRSAHCVVATTETALYANVILRKGVIGVR
jgi:L-fucose mutarotase